MAIAFNWYPLALLIAAVVAMAVGAFWYSPRLFGRQWMRLSGITEKDMKKAKQRGMWKSYLLNFISVIITGYILSLFMKWAGASNIADGAVFGFLAWLGFIGTTTLGMVLWDGRPWKLWLLTNGYSLASMVIIGGILGLVM